jgi:hypothetical protein
MNSSDNIIVHIKAKSSASEIIRGLGNFDI